VNIVAPRFFLLGPRSHRGFSPPLNRHTQLETNENQNWRKLDSKLNHLQSIQILCINARNADAALFLVPRQDVLNGEGGARLRS
jgi:hypothetical protein